MIVQAIVFYVFAAVLIGAGAVAVSTRNTVHAVLFLILAFFSAAGLFVLLGAEFLAMVLVVVYVGAVAVLFLFVVMLLDVDVARLRAGFQQYLPIGALVGVVLLIELLVGAVGWHFQPHAAAALAAPTPDIAHVTNTDALGRLIYTHYIFLFQAAGLVLLVAMIGAILLTHRPTQGRRRQVIAKQVARTKATSIEIRKVASGGGV